MYERGVVKNVNLFHTENARYLTLIGKFVEWNQKESYAIELGLMIPGAGVVARFPDQFKLYNVANCSPPLRRFSIAQAWAPPLVTLRRNIRSIMKIWFFSFYC